MLVKKSVVPRAATHDFPQDNSHTRDMAHTARSSGLAARCPRHTTVPRICEMVTQKWLQHFWKTSIITVERQRNVQAELPWQLDNSCVEKRAHARFQTGNLELETNTTQIQLFRTSEGFIDGTISDKRGSNRNAYAWCKRVQVISCTNYNAHKSIQQYTDAGQPFWKLHVSRPHMRIFWRMNDRSAGYGASSSQQATVWAFVLCNLSPNFLKSAPPVRFGSFQEHKFKKKKKQKRPLRSGLRNEEGCET